MKTLSAANNINNDSRLAAIHRLFAIMISSNWHWHCHFDINGKVGLVKPSISDKKIGWGGEGKVATV